MSTRPAGRHTITATMTDDTTEQLACPCEWCQLVRAAGPVIDAALRELEPEYRPPWLVAGPQAPTEEGAR